MTPQAFEQRMKTLADGVPKNANAIKMRVAKQILREVVRTTPVDTSLHKSRWQVVFNEAPLAVFPAYVKGKHGSTSRISSDAAIAIGESRIDRSRPGDVIIVGNNGPVIEKLNNGWSKQAPANFIQAAVRAGFFALRGVSVIYG